MACVTNPPATPSNAHDQDLLLQLHIAEYNAIASRSTTYILIAASMWPVLGIVLSIMAQQWTAITQSTAVLWVGLLVQFFALGWIENSRQQYQNIAYIERNLKPLIVGVFDGTTRFWQYERYLYEERLNKRRNRKFQWWEVGPFGLAIGACLVTVGARLDEHYIWHKPLDWQDLTATAANVGCLALVASATKVLYATQSSMFPSSKSIRIALETGILSGPDFASSIKALYDLEGPRASDFVTECYRHANDQQRTSLLTSADFLASDTSFVRIVSDSLRETSSETVKTAASKFLALAQQRAKA